MPPATAQDASSTRVGATAVGGRPGMGGEVRHGPQDGGLPRAGNGQLEGGHGMAHGTRSFPDGAAASAFTSSRFSSASQLRIQVQRPAVATAAAARTSHWRIARSTPWADQPSAAEEGQTEEGPSAEVGMALQIGLHVMSSRRLRARANWASVAVQGPLLSITSVAAARRGASGGAAAMRGRRRRPCSNRGMSAARDGPRYRSAATRSDRSVLRGGYRPGRWPPPLGWSRLQFKPGDDVGSHGRTQDELQVAVRGRI